MAKGRWTSVDIVIRDKKLRRDYQRPDWHQPAVVRAFDALLSVLAAAATHDDVVALQQFRIHALAGDRAGLLAAHLSANQRAIIALRSDAGGPDVEIIEVVDYH
ncbi:MAG: hypothetical protein IT204_19135 [Fimbriimonadaceae bacterium]|nr:hypothetical protein [Fimbriimonadaceae bacterium]